MPQVPTTPENKAPIKAPAAGRPLLVPPEEQFWKRYSPHNEFPLSSATSIALHVIVIGLLLLIALFLWNRTSKPSDVPEWIPVAMSGQDAKGKASGGGHSGGTKGTDPESVPDDPGDEEPKEDADPTDGGPRLKDLKDDPAVDVPASKDGSRTIVQGKVLEDLGNIGRKAHQVLVHRNVPKTRKGSKDKDGGSGGDKDRGRDKGKDKGTGSKKGELEQRRREKRQVRWQVIFNTRSGLDYQDQLYALGAILVVAEFQPGSNQLLRYRLVIRNKKLASSPVIPKPEDVRKIPGIFWIDDKPESVRSLAQALGLRTAPPLFACFFPQAVEAKLRDLEKGKYGGSEDNIERTIFRVVESPRGWYKGKNSRYDLVCEEVMRKN